MDLSKSLEFFNPRDVGVINIIGCGSVGSTIAENLVRSGIHKLVLWDFDIVEKHNIVNQMFVQEDIGKPKVEALKRLLFEINPSVKKGVTLKPKGWKGQILSGIVFLCVDSIELRREIVELNRDNPNIVAMFDIRTMLTGAQVYAVDWRSWDGKKSFLESMQFSHEEAMKETPVSACGVVLGIATTVRIVSAFAVNNLIKYVKSGFKEYWRFLQFDGFGAILDAFEAT